MNNTIRHTGIVVLEIEKHKNFWIDIIGFEEISDVIESGNSIEKILGMPNVLVRTIKVKDQLGQVLELLGFINPLPIKNAAVEVNSVGITHVAITTDDFNTLADELSDFGFDKLHDPVLSPDHKFKVAYFNFEDIYFLEVVEVQEAAKGPLKIGT